MQTNTLTGPSGITSALFYFLIAPIFLLLSCGVDTPIEVGPSALQDSTSTLTYSTGDDSASEEFASHEPYRFIPRTGEWQRTSLEHLNDGELYFAKEILWRHHENSTPTRQLAEVSLARLAAAQAAWDPATTDAVPRADDIVFVLGQDHQFLRLRDIAHGQRFTFQGRLFEARATLDSLEIRPTGQTVHRVAATFQHPAQKIFDVEIDDLEGNDVGRLTATAEHPFYLPDTDEYRPLRELSTGDRLLASDGSLRVVRSVSAQQDTADVFNFEVEYAHNYFVRPDGDGATVLVHNTKGPHRPDWPELTEMLSAARRGKGNFGIGSGTREQSQAMGQAWVGHGHRTSSDGSILISADGLRQYRPPSWKPRLERTQSNFESREIASGRWQSNAHLDIID